MTTDKISRRTLTGLAAAGVGVPLLAACGDDAPETASDPGGSTGSASPSAPSSSAAPSGGSGGAPAGEPLASTSDIEVGGGEIFTDQEVVVTQPASGEFKCFTAICSHQGCLVSSVSDGTINCDCHGSKYDIATGDVIEGPATFALGEEQITVSGDQITLNA